MNMKFLDLMEQMLDDYPVDPEVIELSIGILDYYDFHEEVLKYIARVAKIRIDEFEDEYYLALLDDIFMEGYFKDILDFYELKRDLFAKTLILNSSMEFHCLKLIIFLRLQMF